MIIIIIIIIIYINININICHMNYYHNSLIN